MATFVPIAPSAQDAKSIVDVPLINQMNENAEANRDNILVASRYGFINARVIYDNSGVFASFSTVPSVDGFDLTIAVGADPSFNVTMAENWNSAQAPSINLSRVISLPGGSVSAVSDIQVNNLSTTNTITIQVGGILNNASYIDLEIKYDRLGTLPV